MVLHRHDSNIGEVRENAIHDIHVHIHQVIMFDVLAGLLMMRTCRSIIGGLFSSFFLMYAHLYQPQVCQSLPILQLTGHAYKDYTKNGCLIVTSKMFTYKRPNDTSISHAMQA